ncbi:MAG: SixA phosphatase family protein, partial [Marinirhabdus sp.]
MKTLYLVRHAKSSWEHDVNDHQRPLKKRGKKDAPMVAAKAAGQVAAPQKIISSDAVRAKTTAAYFKNAFGLPDNHFTLDHSLYDFSGQNVMQIIKNLDNALHTVML